MEMEPIVGVLYPLYRVEDTIPKFPSTLSYEQTQLPVCMRLESTPVDSSAVPETSFFRLPPEIRDQIYEYALINAGSRDDKKIGPFNDRYLRTPCGVQNYGHVLVQPSITIVCRSMRDESLEAMLKRSTLDLKLDSSDRDEWPPNVNKTPARWRFALGERLKHVRNVRFSTFQYVTGEQGGRTVGWNVSSKYKMSLGTSIVATRFTEHQMGYVDDDEIWPSELFGGYSCMCESLWCLQENLKEVGSYNGRILFNLAEEWQAMPKIVEWIKCEDCEKVRLVAATSHGGDESLETVLDTRLDLGGSRAAWPWLG